MGRNHFIMVGKVKMLPRLFLLAQNLNLLKQHPAFDVEINRNSIALQPGHNCIPDPYSIYKNIYKLLPGHYLQLKENDLKKFIP